jgi:dihydrofolate reductase
MRKIITTTFTTLDGVMQAPGGPQEDTSGGFKYGGWMANYADEMTGATIGGFLALPFELLLGRRTYDIFAAYWPTANPNAGPTKPFNATKKYVVSHDEKLALSWNNSILVSGDAGGAGDVVAQIKALKAADGPDLWVHGSGNLIQTLLKEHLIDVMHIWTFPLTLGTGKRLFAEGTQPQDFKLVDSKISPRGVIIATYEPGGAVKLGEMG